jgi:hypothetical protein
VRQAREEAEASLREKWAANADLTTTVAELREELAKVRDGPTRIPMHRFVPCSCVCWGRESLRRQVCVT